MDSRNISPAPHRLRNADTENPKVKHSPQCVDSFSEEDLAVSQDFLQNKETVEGLDKASQSQTALQSNSAEFALLTSHCREAVIMDQPHPTEQSPTNRTNQLSKALCKREVSDGDSRHISQKELITDPKHKLHSATSQPQSAAVQDELFPLLRGEGGSQLGRLQQTHFSLQHNQTSDSLQRLHSAPVNPATSQDSVEFVGPQHSVAFKSNEELSEQDCAIRNAMIPKPKDSIEFQQVALKKGESKMDGSADERPKQTTFAKEQLPNDENTSNESYNVVVGDSGMHTYCHTKMALASCGNSLQICHRNDHSSLSEHVEEVTLETSEREVEENHLLASVASNGNSSTSQQAPHEICPKLIDLSCSIIASQGSRCLEPEHLELPHEAVEGAEMETKDPPIHMETQGRVLDLEGANAHTETGSQMNSVHSENDDHPVCAQPQLDFGKPAIGCLSERTAAVNLGLQNDLVFSVQSEVLGECPSDVSLEKEVTTELEHLSSPALIGSSILETMEAEVGSEPVEVGVEYTTTNVKLPPYDLGDGALLKPTSVVLDGKAECSTSTQASNPNSRSLTFSEECLSKPVSPTDIVPTPAVSTDRVQADHSNSQLTCETDPIVVDAALEKSCFSPSSLLKHANMKSYEEAFDSPIQECKDSPFAAAVQDIVPAWSSVSRLSTGDTRSPRPERPATPSGEESDYDEELAKNKITTTKNDQTRRLLPQCPRPFTPMRDPHGKFISPPARAPGGLKESDTPHSHRARAERHTDMAELAKHEADIEHRSLALKREGFWSLKRLSRVAEPSRPKVHWDYLCEEMQWLSADFAQERRWKRGVARKVVRMVMRYHEEQRQKEEKSKREEQAKLRRVASSIAKEVRAFWSSVEKVVQFKQQSRLEEKRKKALDLQLDFIVGQTERYSDLLSQSLGEANKSATLSNTTRAVSEASSAGLKDSPASVADDDDGDFEPSCEEDVDDEETIEVEEQQEGNDAESHKREIELLREEGTLPLDQLLHTLSQSQDSQSEDEISEDSSSISEEEEDDEFTANEEDAEDEEETIEAQEAVEGDADHSEELVDLAKEGEMSIEQLLDKYKAAYSEDFEMPSPSTSPTSSDGEDEESDTSANVEESDGSESGSESRTSDSTGGLADDHDDGEGMEVLLEGTEHSMAGPPMSRPKKEISHIAATAESLQPKGYTLATTQVKTPIPFLLEGTLREYQHIGLDWLVTMYEKKLNGILADEMGLGKTIQTIALLAHLACEKGNWGPHLIIVPTSVMLNWEMELKRWCPSFKILTYYGSQKERKLKRQGWTKPNAFHVCITSYKLVLQDHQAFRRKYWRYLILDEAQNIKNFKSQRWQSLLNFNSQRRLLLTGTPLQNSLMELWSLMHFLMPHVFQSHREFKEWFSNPLTGMIEGSQEYNEGLVKRLHKVLRPFLLRRIKADVEKQMPKKYEHVVRCRLSKRQRFLYDDFMAQASTRETLASGHFMSVINILMQLRKVCNHPNLFDPRPIQSPFITSPILYTTPSLVQGALDMSPLNRCNLSMFDLVGLEGRVTRYQADTFWPCKKVSRQLVQEIMDSPEPPPRPRTVRMKVNRMFQPLPKTEGRTVLLVNSPRPPCPVSAASSGPRLPSAVDASPAASSQAVVCPVAPIPAPPNVPSPSEGAAVRPAEPQLSHAAVRPPAPVACTSASPFTASTSSTLTQRVLLSPDMQARLPSGEVVSIAQLASLAGRPMSSSQGSKPVTFQLQGNKLTLSGAQLHHVSMAQPRPIQVPSSMVTSSGIVKIVVRPSAVKEGCVPTMAVPPSPRIIPSAPPRHVSSATCLQTMQRLSVPYTAPTAAPLRPVLKLLQGPPPPPTTEPVRQPAVADRGDSSDAPLSVRTAESSACAQSTARRTAQPPPPPPSPFYLWCLADRLKREREQRLCRMLRVNEQRCSAKPVYGHEVLRFLTFLPGCVGAPAVPRPGTWGRAGHTHCAYAQLSDTRAFWMQTRALRDTIHSIDQRLHMLSQVIDRFVFLIPPVEAPPIRMHSCHPPPWHSHQQAAFSSSLRTQLFPRFRSLHRIQCNMRTYFPDLRLIQYDCGKLQTLHLLLRRLKSGGHRVLIFTQMTRMLDVLEQFLNYHGHIYLRLDGTTRVEQRQALMERFNADRRIFCFILSTRSGGVGVNLTGADTVVFYDSDWNPTMDAQAQDRCHRIGQTRDVHIYRLISERTVEENILKKANQKRMLGDMAIEGGNFTTAFFKQQTIRELFDMSDVEKKESEPTPPNRPEDEELLNKQNTNILEQALCRAEDEEDIVAASQAKAEQVAELAEFNESIPFDDGNEAREQEEEELSKAEQEIAALVEQLTPIERYAMNFLEASLEDVCKEELKQAEEQVEAARKGLDQAKEEVLKLPPSDNEGEDLCSLSASEDLVHTTSNRRPRKQKERSAPSRVSGRLRGAVVSPDVDLQTTPKPAPAERHKEKRPETPHLKEDLAHSCQVSALTVVGKQLTQDDPTLTDHVSNKALNETLNLTTSSCKTEQELSEKAANIEITGVSGSLISQAGMHTVSKISTASKMLISTETKAVSSNSACKVEIESAGKGCTREDVSSNLPFRSSTKADCDSKVQFDSNPNKDVNSTCNKDLEQSLKQPKPSPQTQPVHSRSPRKRQSADVELLSSCVEDSPSAKVLRKLPGRLVTVVEEKELPRRKRGSSASQPDVKGEDVKTESELGADESIKGTATTVCKSENKTDLETESPQRQPDQYQASLSPARGAIPYSPTHHSPDMPVLRNLPVRRRLETESRLAAQLAEQHPGRGKGRSGEKRGSLSPNYSRKADTKLEENRENVVTQQSNEDLTPKENVSPSEKRKRGRPPKTPPRMPSSPLEETCCPLYSADPEATEVSERSPSPKRKRGRPRKDFTGQSEMDTLVSSPPGSPVSLHSCIDHTVDNLSPFINDDIPTENNSAAQYNQSTSDLEINKLSFPDISALSECQKTKIEPTQEGREYNQANDREAERQARESVNSPPKVKCHSETARDEGPSEDKPKSQVPVSTMDQEERSSTSSLTQRPTQTSEAEKDELKEDSEHRNRCSIPRRHRSRRSSQESACSSSPSSRSSRSTSTQSSLSKKDDKTDISTRRKKKVVHSDKEQEGRSPCFSRKKKSGDVKSKSTLATTTSENAPVKSGSSSDSEDSSEDKREQRLTRAARRRLEREEQEIKVDAKANIDDQRGRKLSISEQESPRDEPVRVTRKSAGSQQTTKQKPPNPSTPPSSPPVPEVLGKRCSALNAAAKLLAMRGRGGGGSNVSSCEAKGPDIEGKGVQNSTPSSSEKVNKVESKALADEAKPVPVNSTPTEPRSTRQRPGNLVPPLETEIKKKSNKKSAEKDESKSPGGSRRASSERGEGSSLSSNSSSSSSSSRHHAPGLSSSRWRGGAEPSEGTPDRVLRSVAALAAAQARTPANNTRSSSLQHARRSKT